MVEQIEVWSDYACPWCYISKRRLERSLQVVPLSRSKIKWRHFELGPDRPKVPERTVLQILVEDHGDPESVLLENFSRIELLAKAEGLAFNMRSLRPVNTHDAHRVGALADSLGLGNEFDERAFFAYHVEQANLADWSVLTDLAAELGIGVEACQETLATGKYHRLVEEDRARAAAIGVSAVPTLVFGDGTRISANSNDLRLALEQNTADLSLVASR